MNAQKYVLIFERCPRPGYWEPTPICWLQDAEFKSGVNKRFYHEHVKYASDNLLLYPEPVAMKILSALQKHRAYAEYTLLYDI